MAKGKHIKRICCGCKELFDYDGENMFCSKCRNLKPKTPPNPHSPKFKRKARYAINKAYEQYIISCLKTGEKALPPDEWFKNLKKKC